MFSSHESANSGGVAILIKNGVDCLVHSCILDPSGRFIIVKVEIDDKVHALVNIYAPNRDKDLNMFFKNIQKVIRDEDIDCEENIITISGDFNCPLHPVMYKKRGVMTPRKTVVESIGCLQSEFDLVDIWRIKNPDTKSYTWSQKQPNVFCRLDY